LTHATGDPSYLVDAFLPTAHIEGYRDGEFSSWDLESFAAVFDGPAPDEADRGRRIERLDVRGSVATAVMSLHHGEVDFTDVFVLIRRPDGEWRIANKAYDRRVNPTWKPGRREARYTCSRDATAAATRSIASSIGTPLSWRPSR
jgi:hypothetical protein